MTLDEYTGLDDKETFTYWLEHRLIGYGSIRGGSAYKFGVFRKEDTSKEHPKKSYKSDDNYAWHEKFGERYGIIITSVNLQ
jgi:5-methylcytosine-specific restriction protein B